LKVSRNVHLQSFQVIFKEMKITLQELKQIIKEEMQPHEETFSLVELRGKDPAAFDSFVESSDDEFWYDEDVLMTSDGENDYMYTPEEGWQLVEYEE